MSSAAIAAFLAASYLFAPSYVTLLFGIPAHPSAELMAGRAAILFAALGMIYWWTRDSAERATRLALMRASALAMAAMLVFGLWQMGRGFAGPGHLVATAAEATYLALFVGGWWREARAQPS